MSQEAVKPDQVNSEGAGNYLISLRSEIFYVGEAKNLASRVRQQFVAKTSTFYKTYAKRVADPAPIGAFRVRYMETAVGRKEVEEFGIVNAACSLNKFQRGKRDMAAAAANSAIWSEVQRQHATIIAQGQATVLSAPFYPWVKSLAKACAGFM